MHARLATFLRMALVGGALCACGAFTAAPAATFPDGKEAIYSFLSQGKKSAADAALRDVWDLGARSKPVRIAPITWNENPFDKYWRVLFYSLRPLSNLLHTYYATRDRAYLAKLLEVVQSYDAFEAQRGDAPHEYLDDPHTAAFREMMLVNIHGKLARSGDLPADVAAGMRASIAKTARFLAVDKNFQDGENHGFNEAAALLVAAVNFPDFPESAGWQSLALGRLGGLMTDTIDADGVEIEDSPFYHFYVLSFVAQDSRWMHAYGVPLPDGFDDRMGAMLGYATYSPQPNGMVPLLGASVTLDVRKLLPDVYDEASLEQIAGFDETSPELTYVRTAAKSGRAPTERNKRFAASGQSFLRSTFDADGFEDATWLSFNVGKVRSPHCHLDALGMTYVSGGVPLLVDSGLYEYGSLRSPNEWAAYFRGTRAHNTVVVDGADQEDGDDYVDAVYPGLVASGDAWAYQSGSHGLYAGVTHSRAVLLLKQDLALVLDFLDSADGHTYAQTWHLSPDETFVQQGLDVLASDASGQANLALHQGVTEGILLDTTRGQDTPVIQGYYSSEYGSKVANDALEYTITTTDQGFATLIASGPRATQKAVVKAAFDAKDGGVGVKATVCVGDTAVDVTVQNLAGSGETIAVTPSTGCGS